MLYQILNNVRALLLLKLTRLTFEGRISQRDNRFMSYLA